MPGRDGTGQAAGDQRAVMAFLGDAATHDSAVVERIDTHISAVFLAGERAFKLKKAVRLPFLDFTRPSDRRRACLAELEVNREAAPELYDGVWTVLADGKGRLRLSPGEDHGEGEDAVDWVVVMRRFDQDGLFSRMAARGALTRALVADLAERIAAFHSAAPPRPRHGGTDAMRDIVSGNAASLSRFAPEVFSRGRIKALTQATLARLERHGACLEARRESGLVRRCHGDLHLNNVCLFDGRPMPFDAIEFSEAFSCIDVLYDLAFLLMDLEAHGLRRLACLAFNHYADCGGDVWALEVLPAFLSMRAAVRAHVLAAAAGEVPAGAERVERGVRAQAYFSLAEACLAPPPPRLVAVAGLSGSGKSRLGRELAPFLGASPGALVVRSDVVRKQLAGVGLLERLPPAAYTPEMSERTYAEVFARCRRALAAGHAVVADCVFARPGERAAVEGIARAAGVPFHGFWLEAPPEVMAARIRERRGNVSDATPQVLQRQLDYDLGEIGWTRLDSSGPKEATLAAAREKLQEDT